MVTHLNGYLADIFDLPVFCYHGDDYIPFENIMDDLYWYIILESFGSMVDLADGVRQRFTGVVLIKPEHYRRYDPTVEFNNCKIHGIICAHSRVVSRKANWQVIDTTNLQSLINMDHPISLECFVQSPILKMRSNRDSSCTISALTNQLLFGLVLLCQARGFYVAKTFNHYSIDTGETTTSRNSFFIEFSIDGGEKHSHVHLPYQFWNRLDAPVIPHLSPQSVLDQPNLSVLLQKIDEEIEAYIRPAINLHKKIDEERKCMQNEKEIRSTEEETNFSATNIP